MGVLEIALKALQAMGPITAAVPEVKALIDSVGDMLDEDDQATLQEGYADLIEDNAAGHARLQAKLAAAAKRPSPPG